MNATKEMTAEPEAPEDQGQGHDQSEESQPSQVQRSSSGPQGPTVGNLGLTRWVQYVFVVMAVALLWFLDKVATLVWENFAEPPTFAVTAASAVVGFAITIGLYRNERAHGLVSDVVLELSKVTWPTRKETYSSTVIVIITSLIAAGIVGGFDFVWSFFTDLLYKHKV